MTAENRNACGGPGSAVAEAAAKTVPVPIEMVGTDDRFGQVGTETFLRAEYRLNAGSDHPACVPAVTGKTGYLTS